MKEKMFIGIFGGIIIINAGIKFLLHDIRHKKLMDKINKLDNKMKQLENKK
jgi:hypothetical protein